MGIAILLALVGIITVLFIAVISRWIFRINDIVLRLDHILTELRRSNGVSEPQIPEVHKVKAMSYMQ